MTKKTSKAQREATFRCEVKRPFMVNGVKVMKWKEIDVSKVDDDQVIRCRECHGHVRIHRQKKIDGVPDHVEHHGPSSHQDSEYCSLGKFFHGDERKTSRNAVE